MRKISVIGLGYVGLPVALAFAEIGQVIGFDINPQRIRDLAQGKDDTQTVTTEALKKAQLHFTTNPQDLAEADFHIIAVPTPVDEVRHPDFKALLAASQTVGSILKEGDIVVYESTVYPGATEERCLPILEQVSQLKCNRDFSLAYSPERINPGDSEHTFTNIVKVVSASNPNALRIVAETYGAVVKAGVHAAASIETAEAAKVLENTQRDLNIALMNELALICHKMGIDTQDVIDAAATKWNFLPFRPGLVGGHCIGVDPFYLTYRAKQMGYRPEVILAGRRINDAMGKHIAEQTVKELIKMGCCIRGSRVAVLGLAFKEDVPDLRNSKVIDLIRELHSYTIEVDVYDPVVSFEEARHEYGVELCSWETILKEEAGSVAYDALIVAVAHHSIRAIPLSVLKTKLKPKTPLLVDVKSIWKRDDITEAGMIAWRL